jgi:hypothetical protein
MSVVRFTATQARLYTFSAAAPEGVSEEYNKPRCASASVRRRCQAGSQTGSVPALTMPTKSVLCLRSLQHTALLHCSAC